MYQVWDVPWSAQTCAIQYSYCVHNWLSFKLQLQARKLVLNEHLQSHSLDMVKIDTEHWISERPLQPWSVLCNPWKMSQEAVKRRTNNYSSWTKSLIHELTHQKIQLYISVGRRTSESLGVVPPATKGRRVTGNAQYEDSVTYLLVGHNSMNIRVYAKPC